MVVELTDQADRAGPRLAPTSEQDWDDGTRALFDQLERYNIFTTLAHHPALLRRWLRFGRHVLAHNTLPVRTRELVILRVGWRCGSAYEFGQHTLIGQVAGLSDDEIRRVIAADPITEGDWPDDEALALRAADELVDAYRLEDATWSALTRAFSVEQVLDLIFTVGQYVMVSMALNSLEVELDEGLPGFPEGVS